MKAPQQSLKDWGDQKWRTKSGKPSSKTGERYLPEAAIKAIRWYPTVPAGLEAIEGRILDRVKAAN